MIKISIVLPCYNAENTILDTLNSIVQQIYKNFELIIINDGSTDKSLEIIKDFVLKNNIANKIISRKNKGFLYSLHEGIMNAKGKYIARIDADDLWKPNHLNLIKKEFDQNVNLVLVGSNAIYIDENMKELRKSHQPETKEDIIKHMMNDSAFIHSSVVFKKEAYMKTPGYLIGKDEASKHIADYNLWFELSKIGDCKNIKIHTVLYRVLENSMSRQLDKCINYQSRLKIMKKVYKYYEKYHINYIINRIKIQLRIIQNCFLRKMQK